MKVDKRFVLVLVMMAMFCGWVALVAFWFVPMITGVAPMIFGVDALDPMMTMIAGLGIGGVTNFFIVLLTLSWQFYFRKKEKVTKPEDK